MKLGPKILGGAEGYIYDGDCAVLDAQCVSRMVTRTGQAVVMAIFLIFCPLAGPLKPIKRPDPASIRKILAEGGLNEIITFLVWMVDTRQFISALPIEKWKAWSNSISESINKRKVTYKELSTLIGKLNHVCFVIPDARHFMRNLRKVEAIARRKGCVKLPRRSLDDLTLWLEILDSEKTGILINRTIFWKKNLITYYDASKVGFGGYSPHTGIAWRYEFTPEEQQAFTINCKEYIGSKIDLMIQADYDNIGSPCSCYLNCSDITITVGWLRKSNYDPDKSPIHNEIARQHARHIMSINGCNYSQHLPGKDNVVTDCLLRYFHLSKNQIIALLTSLHPSLSPAQNKIVNLYPKHTSSVAYMAQKCPGKEGSPKRHIKSDIAAGISGWSSSAASSTSVTPIWKTSQPSNDSVSAVLSCIQCDGVTLGEPSKQNKSREILPDWPLTTWKRTLW